MNREIRIYCSSRNEGLVYELADSHLELFIPNENFFMNVVSQFI